MIRHITTPLAIIFLLIFQVSCSKQMYQTGSESIIYPSPPDTARVQFLTRYGNSFDITGNRSKFKTFVAGKEKVLPIFKPYGVAIHNGKLFIADTGIPGLQIIDLQEKSFEYFTPEGRGFLKMPINCYVDNSGDLYVTDLGRKQVVIYNENLEYIGEIGGSEDYKPIDVFVSGDSILVTNSKNHRIDVYDKTSRQLLFWFPEAEDGDENWLYNPLNLFVAEGKIYVSDFGDFTVKIFSMQGEYISSVGGYGTGLGQFVRPKGIAVDREQNLYVVDAGFENVQIFNKEGQLLMFFGGAYKGPGDMSLPAQITIDYDNLSFFEKYVDPAFRLKYLIFVTNQYGPDKVSVYGRVESNLK